MSGAELLILIFFVGVSFVSLAVVDLAWRWRRANHVLTEETIYDTPGWDIVSKMRYVLAIVTIALIVLVVVQLSA